MTEREKNIINGFFSFVYLIIIFLFILMYILLYSYKLYIFTKSFTRLNLYYVFSLNYYCFICYNLLFLILKLICKIFVLLMYVLLILVVTLSFHLISVSLSKFQFDDKKKKMNFICFTPFFVVYV